SGEANQFLIHGCVQPPLRAAHGTSHRTHLAIGGRWTREASTSLNSSWGGRSRLHEPIWNIWTTTSRGRSFTGSRCAKELFRALAAGGTEDHASHLCCRSARSLPPGQGIRRAVRLIPVDNPRLSHNENRREREQCTRKWKTSASEPVSLRAPGNHVSI